MQPYPFNLDCKLKCDTTGKLCILMCIKSPFVGEFN